MMPFIIGLSTPQPAHWFQPHFPSVYRRSLIVSAEGEANIQIQQDSSENENDFFLSGSKHWTIFATSS